MFHLNISYKIRLNVPVYISHFKYLTGGQNTWMSVVVPLSEFAVNRNLLRQREYSPTIWLSTYICSVSFPPFPDYS